jgi:hypothetical protein
MVEVKRFGDDRWRTAWNDGAGRRSGGGVHFTSTKGISQSTANDGPAWTEQSGAIAAPPPSSPPITGAAFLPLRRGFPHNFAEMPNFSNHYCKDKKIVFSL